jgi:peptidoglycan hydrolase-like protein with peptidoglycan-binding domain
MSSRSYISPGLVLTLNPVFSQRTQDLQRDLRALGYFAGPVDGVFGNITRKGILALQYDLVKNNGASTGNDGSAPVAVRSYNNGTVTALTGVVDQGLAACIAAMLDDERFPKLPFSADPSGQNKQALAEVAQAASSKAPLPFLLQILAQESGQRHFQIPEGSNLDNFVTVGLDHNNEATPVPITSHGYGIGQFTLFHHPPRPEEIAGVVSNALLNVGAAISMFRAKFDNFVVGPTDTAADRLQEHGTAPLRECRYAPGDALYMNDCTNCCRAAGTFDIVAGVTPVYAGAQLNYDTTQYHRGNYTDVPVRAKIPCDWPYAIRRYNGSGVNSYDYQAEVLLRIAQQHA